MCQSVSDAGSYRAAEQESWSCHISFQRHLTTRRIGQSNTCRSKHSCWIHLITRTESVWCWLSWRQRRWARHDFTTLDVLLWSNWTAAADEPSNLLLNWTSWIAHPDQPSTNHDYQAVYTANKLIFHSHLCLHAAVHTQNKQPPSLICSTTSLKRSALCYLCISAWWVFHSVFKVGVFLFQSCDLFFTANC